MAVYFCFLMAVASYGYKPDWDVNSSLTWENCYVTEGIDNMPRTSFLFSELDVGWHGLWLGAWWAEALSVSCNEVNLFSEYGVDAGPLSVYAGATRLEFPSGADSATWELYAGIEHSAGEYLTLFMEIYYDIDEVKGGFMETGIGADIPIPVLE